MDGRDSYNVMGAAPEPSPTRQVRTEPQDKFGRAVLQWIASQGQGCDGMVKLQVYGSQQKSARAPIIRNPAKLLLTVDWRPSEDANGGVDQRDNWVAEEFLRGHEHANDRLDWGETYFVDAVVRGFLIARTKINEGATRAAATTSGPVDPFNKIKAAFNARMEREMLGQFEGVGSSLRGQAPAPAQPAPIRVSSGFLVHPDDMARLYEQEREEHLAAQRRLDRIEEDRRRDEASDERNAPFREAMTKVVGSLVEIGEKWAHKKLDESDKKKEEAKEAKAAKEAEAAKRQAASQAPAVNRVFSGLKEGLQHLAAPAPRRYSEPPTPPTRDFRTAAGPPVTAPPPTPRPATPPRTTGRGTFEAVDLYDSPLSSQAMPSQNDGGAVGGAPHGGNPSGNPFLDSFGTSGPGMSMLDTPSHVAASAAPKPSARLAADLSERLVPVVDVMIDRLTAKAHEIGLFRRHKILEACPREGMNLFLPECLRVGITVTELLLLTAEPQVFVETMLRAITAERRRKLGPLAMGLVADVLKSMAFDTDWNAYLNHESA